ncbi:MAG: polysaccharide biosynthesis/export family protein [Bacteroidota bacterium]
MNTFILKHRPKNTVQPYDNLYIKIISPDASTSQMFNSETGGAGLASVNYHMISYTVSDSGYIDFPFVGQIYVEGLTILEAKDVIQKALSQYISNAAVIVKFVGKSITIVGEVLRQGEFTIFSNNLIIFKAFAMAGGLTDFGNRKNVTIIREKDGKANYYTVDLTDKRITSSEFYYLKPDDVIIVHPLSAKSWGFASFPYSLLMTSLTTLIVILTFIRTAP